MGTITKDKINRKIALLVAHKAKHQNFDNLFSADPELNTWVKTQREKFRRNLLEPDVAAQMKIVGINLSPRVMGSPENIAERIACLKRFREETGHDRPQKRHANKEYASFAQWLTRQKRAFNGGTLPQNIIDELEKVGITLTTPKEQYMFGGKVNETQSFQNNLAVLKSCLDNAKSNNKPRDIAFRNAKLSNELDKSYRFIEHMILKVRNGILPDDHKDTLVALDFTVNGKHISEVLEPKPSITSAEGVKILQEDVAKKYPYKVVNPDEIRTYFQEPFVDINELSVKLNCDVEFINKTLMKHFIESRHFIYLFNKEYLRFSWETISLDLLNGAFKDCID